MAVDLQTLAVNLRIIGNAAVPLPTGHAETLQPLLDYAVAEVESRAPDAPDVVKDQAVIRLAGYMLDSPAAPRGDGYADPMRNSGVAVMLARYRPLRAVTIDAESDAA